MNILLIRHGETDGNLKGFVQNANTPLNASGKNQATLLHKALDRQNISKVLSSDFTRAEQTIKKFAQEEIFLAFGQQPYAREDFGELKGMFYKDINKTEVFEENFSPRRRRKFKGNSKRGLITHGMRLSKPVTH